MTSSNSDKQEASSGVAADEAALWRVFISPRSDEDFFHAWLTLLCRQLVRVNTGVVLLQSDEAGTFQPAAIWPHLARDLSFLAAVAQRALAEKRGIVHRPDNSPGAALQVAYPLEVSGRVLGAVVLEAGARPDNEVQALLRQLHWGVAWVQDFIHCRELASAEEKTGRIGSVMEVIATALRQSALQQTLFETANQVARILNCSRVSFGLATGNTLRMAAFSNAAWFEKDTTIVKHYLAAMEEAMDRLAPVSWMQPSQEASGSEPNQPAPAHASLAQEGGALCIHSAPLKQGATCIGVITLERDSEPFTPADLAWIDALAGLLPSVIALKQHSEQGYAGKIREDTGKLLARLFGPRHLVWKFGSAIALLLMASLALIESDYRVSAKMVVEGEVQRAAVVPFDGFVLDSHVRAGDTVKEGQILCELDDRDLRLEQQKWAGESEQHSRELREAMAGHNSTAVQVLSAQLQQSEAQMKLASARISRAKITSPFDGVVITGDLSQLIGSPVEQGKKLFEIAPLHTYRIILQVDERELRHVSLGQPGKLVITGIAGEPVPFHVSQITPVASAQDGRNFFRVEAKLEQSSAQMRPGMEGIGKISVGERRLWWILTHTFTDWLRLTLWTWLP
ncbi:MAG: GAF domain-containing protein [Gallionellaceae bacterium]|nr:MAG: GAF domain-containing protein [Gallionellaceae bacterium]